MAEAASTAIETGAISKDKIMRVYVTSLPVPLEFRIPPQSLPETESVNVVLLHCGCLSLIPFIEFMNLEFGTTHQVQMC